MLRKNLIDELVLGIGYGDDYEVWLTHEGRRKAEVLATLCHRFGKKFIAYFYTDQPYIATYRKFGAAAVRERFVNDAAFLAGTGTDGFLNRNLPECLTSCGAPLPGDSESVSEYLIPAASQLWSGILVGAKSEPGSFTPQWIAPELPDQTPQVFVVIPESTDKSRYPLPHQADYYPDTYKGLVWQYHHLFGLLGCRTSLITTAGALDDLIQADRTAGILIFAHHCCQEAWLQEWLAQNSNQLLLYIRRGGTVLTEAGTNPDDRVLASLFGLSLVTAAPGEICGPLFPITSEYAYDSRALPGWVESVIVDAPSGPSRQPVILAGRIGKGSVLCSAIPCLAHDAIRINPQDGPQNPGILRVWQTIGHWLLPGGSLPLDQAFAWFNEQYRQTHGNLLPNGDFSQGTILGYPAFWLIRSRNPTGFWCKTGQGVSLSEGDPAGNAISLDMNRVKDITSLTFPLDANCRYRISGQCRVDDLPDTPHAQYDRQQPCYISFHYGVRGANIEYGKSSTKFTMTSGWQPFQFQVGPICESSDLLPLIAWISISWNTRHPSESDRELRIYLSNLRVCPICE
ncbi:MAG TPA: hypothetical protein DD640_05095 [Clostridiales bacterium]|nr:hypothetical protein [Clostridiales bacterium]